PDGCTREGLMSKSSRWPRRTTHAAFRMVEGGLDRTLQAEVRDVVEEQRWAHFITRRNAENDATHRALRARQRSKSPWRVFPFGVGRSTCRGLLSQVTPADGSPGLSCNTRMGSGAIS